ncbi:AMIN domain-containing protein [Corynebacterium renale]|nr:AMIN domain-containing protein [Corynebacterium renale]
MESKPLGRFTSADTKVVTEVVEAGTFEARTQYVIGLKSEAPYSVQVLQDPTRLVIDIVY